MRKQLLIGVMALSVVMAFGCGAKTEEGHSGTKQTQKEDTEKKSQQETTQKKTEEESKTMEMSYKVEELNVSANGRTVYAKGYVPDDNQKHPTIILSHGYNGSHADFAKECMYYARNGYNAYAIDFCGGSGRSKSTGASTDMTIFTEKEDLLAVFDYVMNLDNVDKEQMYLFGGSQGGLVTTLVAEERADKVKAMALYYPALNIPDDWRNNYKTVEEIPEEVDFWGLKLGKGFFTSIREFQTFDNIGKYPNEVLIIHGDKDTIVMQSVAERAQKHYANAELIILPGEGHGFTPAGGKIAMEKVLEFLNAQ